jgi:cytochrome b561
MVLRNTVDGFGLISRLLHWTMALGVIFMLALGNRIADMKPDLSTLYLYGLHKTLGIVILALAVLRLIWHRFSAPPPPIGPPSAWGAWAARAAHALIYVLLISIPLTGWFASSATGIDVMIFDRWKLPPIAPVSELWETRGFAVHDILTKALFGLILLHILGALKREIDGDGTLTRMISGKR